MKRFRLKKRERYSKGLPRLASELIACVEFSIQVEGGPNSENIHEARTRIKRLRALLRLIRGSIDKDSFKQIDRWARDTARQLSTLRDSHVMLETLEQLRDRDQPTKSMMALRDHLAHQKTQAHSETFQGSDTVQVCLELLGKSRVAIDDWDLPSDFSAVAKGLRETYRRGRRTFHLCRKEPSTANLHDWRKRVKYLLYQLEILDPLWPRILRAMACELAEVGDTLGMDHDLAILAGKAVELEECGEIIQAAEIQRAKLQKAAFRIGGRIYAEPPRAFVRRFEQWAAVAKGCQNGWK